jgi:hypothetical protein
MPFSVKLGKSGNFAYGLQIPNAVLVQYLIRITHMRMRVLCSAFGLAFLALLGGCSKSSPTDQQMSIEVEGVKLDTPQLLSEFLESSPELYKQVNDAVTNVRYQGYVQAMMELDKVLQAPGLNDKQKKLITKVIGQLKQVIAKAPPQPAQ